MVKYSLHKGLTWILMIVLNLIELHFAEILIYKTLAKKNKANRNLIFGSHNIGLDRKNNI